MFGEPVLLDLQRTILPVQVEPGFAERNHLG